MLHLRPVKPLTNAFRRINYIRGSTSQGFALLHMFHKHAKQPIPALHLQPRLKSTNTHTCTLCIELLHLEGLHLEGKDKPLQPAGKHEAHRLSVRALQQCEWPCNKMRQTSSIGLQVSYLLVHFLNRSGTIQLTFSQFWNAQITQQPWIFHMRNI